MLVRTITRWRATPILALIAFSALAQPFAIGERTGSFLDSGRNRTVGVELYYPADQAGLNQPLALGEFPLLVVGHGFVMGVDAYSNLWQFFVPKGYIVVLPTTEAGLAPDHQAFGEDLAFLVQAMQAADLDNTSPYFGHVAATSALMGHSMGGGASFIGASNNTGITALVNLAAAETNPSAVQAASGVVVPTLLFGASEDCVTPIADHQQPMYDALTVPCASLVTILGGGHCYFAENNFACSFGESTCSPNLTISRAEQQSVVNDLAGPFLDHWLKGDAAALTTFLDSLSNSPRLTAQSTCFSLQTGSLEPTRVRMVPVPASDVLHVMLDDRTIGDWWITDVSGRTVLTGSSPNRSVGIDVSRLVAGSYHFVAGPVTGTVRAPFIVSR